MSHRKLYKFQEEGALFLAKNDAALLADEQGTGKTIQAIAACNFIGARSILIVCKAGLKLNWQIELKRWLYDPRLNIQILSGLDADLKIGSDIAIVNYELIALSAHLRTQLKKRKWDVGIWDEAHFLKGRTSLRTKAILLRGGVASYCTRKWFMTGTPVLNRPEELYPILKASAPSVIHPYTDFDAFAKHFCDAYWDGFQLVTKGSSNEAELHKRLTAGFMLRRLKKDVLPELPDKSYQLVTIPAATDHIKKLVAEEFFWSKQEARKISGVSSGQDISILRHELALSKVKKAVEHIKDVLEENQKVVVFGYHRDVIKELALALAAYQPQIITGDTEPWMRQHIVEQFQNVEKSRVFIGQIQAAGDGITLTAASTVVFVESSWVPGEIDQATDRLHRIGQKNAVLAQFLVIENSLESHMLRTVIDKKQIIQEIVDGQHEPS